MKLEKDLREFVELLNSRKVDYIIVGAHAVAFHGHPRYTGDIDLLVMPARDNAERMLDVLRDFGFGGVSIDVEDLTLPNRVVQLGQPPNRIDLLTSISGVNSEEAWQGRVEGELDGLRVSFLGLKELLTNKRASAREKDLADFQTLSAIAKKKQK